LAYATSGMAITAIIFLDYIIAFTVFGFGGIFKKRIKNQGTALAMGVILVGILRYICHIISGCTVWIGLSIPDTQSLIYSTAYNATYMIPEIIISVVGAICISKLLSFKEDTITRTQVVKKEEKSDLAVLFNGIGITSLLFMAVWSIKEIAFNLQNAETGDFDVTGFANVNWMSVIIVAVICIIVFSIFYILSKKASSNNKISLKWLFNAIPFVSVIIALIFDIYFIINTFSQSNLENPVTGYDYINMILLSIGVLILSVIVVLRYLKKKNQ
ncbi:MAG: energy-coupled thiamine transporter ThiT, partial [Oscillospiraceae bacterium]